MTDPAGFVERSDRLLWWFAHRCRRRGSVVWDVDDLYQEFRVKALRVARRYDGLPEEELTYIVTRALPRCAWRAMRRDLPPGGYVLDVDVARLVDPAWGVPFARAEALREVERVLVGLELTVAREVLDPSPGLAGAVAAAVTAAPRRPLYVTVRDVAVHVGVNPLRAYRAFAGACARLAEAHA